MQFFATCEYIKALGFKIIYMHCKATLVFSSELIAVSSQMGHVQNICNCKLLDPDVAIASLPSEPAIVHLQGHCKQLFFKCVFAMNEAMDLQLVPTLS